MSHSTHSGFVEGRSILDNICTFWEASTLASWRGEDLSISCWTFHLLEGTLVFMDLPPQWIHGVATLYSLAHSQVLVGGVKGDQFALSRWVRQEYSTSSTASRCSITHYGEQVLSPTTSVYYFCGISLWHFSEGWRSEDYQILESDSHHWHYSRCQCSFSHHFINPS